MVKKRLKTKYFQLYLEGNVFAIETVEIRVLNDPISHEVLIAQTRCGEELIASFEFSVQKALHRNPSLHRTFKHLVEQGRATIHHLYTAVRGDLDHRVAEVPDIAWIVVRVDPLSRSTLRIYETWSVLLPKGVSRLYRLRSRARSVHPISGHLACRAIGLRSWTGI